MKYDTVLSGTFLRRPNRFLAEVLLDGAAVTVHVKNTGRCRELLLPGAEVLLAPAASPARKTKYDLVAVQKPGLGLVNIDSLAPNQAAGEWLAGQGFALLRPEYRWGASRFDFYGERDGARYLMEVKGCTLERDGVGWFPDAPTERGAKHLRELAAAVSEGFVCRIIFAIPMPGVTEVRPNTDTDPAFAEALEAAAAAGVEVWFLPCHVTETGVTPLAGIRRPPSGGGPGGAAQNS